MNEHPDKFDIAHLGPNFWRDLLAECPTYSTEIENHAFLLSLDDDGHLLHHLHLFNRVLCNPSVIRDYVKLATYSEASAIVRIQTQLANQTNPFEVGSPHTEALYDAAHSYGLHLADVVLPRFI